MDYMNNLRMLRAKHKLSQSEIAEILETTQQHYSCYENGKNEIPVRHIIKICKHFGISADWLLGLTEDAEATK